MYMCVIVENNKGTYTSSMFLFCFTAVRTSGVLSYATDRGVNLKVKKSGAISDGDGMMAVVNFNTLSGSI